MLLCILYNIFLFIVVVFKRRIGFKVIIDLGFSFFVCLELIVDIVLFGVKGGEVILYEVVL